MTFFTKRFVRILITAAAIITPLSAAATTVRFYLEETATSTYDVSGFFDLTSSGSSLSVGEFDIETGAGDFTRLSRTLETDGFSYTDTNGSVALFSPSGSTLKFLNENIRSIDGFTASNPVELRLPASSFSSYIETVLGGGSVTTTVRLTECFNCSPFREGGVATLTTIAPSTENPGGGNVGGEIPLPAGVWLLLGGLGLLASKRRRNTG